MPDGLKEPTLRMVFPGDVEIVVIHEFELPRRTERFIKEPDTVLKNEMDHKKEGARRPLLLELGSAFRAGFFMIGERGLEVLAVHARDVLDGNPLRAGRFTLSVCRAVPEPELVVGVHHIE